MPSDFDSKPPWLMSDIESLIATYQWQRSVLIKIHKAEGQSTASHVIFAEIVRLNGLIEALYPHK